MKTATPPIPIAHPRTKAGVMLLQTFLEFARAHRDPRQYNVETAAEAVELERELTARLEQAKAALSA